MMSLSEDVTSCLLGKHGWFFLELCAESRYVKTRRPALVRIVCRIAIRGNVKVSLISSYLGFPRIAYRPCPHFVTEEGSTKCPTLPR